LLTTTQVSTYAGDRLLTRATGFFFGREDRLYLVTSRHVLHDAPSGHLPDSIRFVLHADAEDLSKFSVHPVELYSNGTAAWHQGGDGGGDIDVAVIRVDRSILPAGALVRWFGPDHLLQSLDSVEIGTSLLLLGYPLGFQDAVHHLPVARQMIVASAFGVRFQRKGCFLTDGRAHRGSSGAPVVMKCAGDADGLPWKLLGVHATRMDVGGRDIMQDESLGLNCAWYADILMTLTDDAS
jgi:hypothetical protein